MVNATVKSHKAHRTALHQPEVEKLEKSIETKRVRTDPPFTFAQLKAAIPAHCFVRSNWRSFSYLFANILACMVVLAFGIALEVYGGSLPLFVQLPLWSIYWIAQGCLCTGLWVIAHECGHRSFSESMLINDTVGLIVHSFLLVPYHAWRISHARHHAHTNHMELDEVFVPAKKYDLGEIDLLLKSTFIGRIVALLSMELAGWQVYLLFNTAGRRYSRQANHFSPSSPIFGEHQRGAIVLSDIALLVVLTGLGYTIHLTSILTVLKFYIIPYLIVNFWLVTITLLQHTDVTLPHYESSDWTWIKGALCTVDRSFGRILNSVFHHIHDTHVVHHLFSHMPHYHAVEATAAIKPLLGEYYCSNNTNVFVALWKTTVDCAYVESENSKGVLWWKKV